jgi:hypothetical protein
MFLLKTFRLQGEQSQDGFLKRGKLMIVNFLYMLIIKYHFIVFSSVRDTYRLSVRHSAC